MNPEYSLQDVLWCHICETPVSHMYCDICQVNLGKLSLGEHLSDDLKELFKKKGSSTKCPKHSSKQCELHCE